MATSGWGKPRKATDAGKKVRVTLSKQPPQELQHTATGAMPRLTKYQKFTPGRVARGSIKNATYNPRTIDPHARKKMLKVIRTKGLVSSITWNRRTGNLVGGHQRLSILDALEGSAAYSLDVDIVDCSAAEEVELNGNLNNPAIQGTYDVVRLEELFSAGKFNFEAVGFDAMDVQMLFPQSPQVESMFALQHQPEEVQKTALDIEEINRIKRETKAHRERAKEEDDTEFHCLVVFKNREEREHFMDLMGKDPNDRYLDGRVLLSHLDEARRKGAQ
jgi:hypothetical protein